VLHDPNPPARAFFLVVSLLVHLAAAALFSYGQQRLPAQRVQTARLYATLIAEIRLPPASVASAATAPEPPAKPVRKPSRKGPPTVAEIAAPPKRAPEAENKAEPKEEPKAEATAAHAAEPKDEPALAVAKPEYRYARRARAFHGGRSRDDDAAPTALARDLPTMLSAALARSVWAVTSGALDAGDGACEVQAPPPDAAGIPWIECTSADLTAALQRVEAAKLQALGTWLRGGYVRAIELRFESGQATFSTRG
jgi:hypothetical protein